MAEFEFSCPHCSRRMECDSSYSGSELTCPACGKSLIVPQEPGPVSASLRMLPPIASPPPSRPPPLPPNLPKPPPPVAKPLEKSNLAAEIGGRILRRIIIRVCVAVIVGVAGYIGSHWFTQEKAKNEPAKQTVSKTVKAAPSEADSSSNLDFTAAPPPHSQTAADSSTPVASTKSAIRPTPLRGPAPTNFPSLKVKGIIYRPDEPLAMINNETLRVGDEIAGVRVARIEAEKVVVEWDGYQKELSLGSSGVHTNK